MNPLSSEPEALQVAVIGCVMQTLDTVLRQAVQ
jgi:hypothetical protein